LLLLMGTAFFLARSTHGSVFQLEIPAHQSGNA
jgi:hypothetical protein